MKAIFYDRKNKREVSSDQLLPIKYIQSVATIDTDDTFLKTGRRYEPSTYCPYTEEDFLADMERRGWSKDDWDKWIEEETPLAVFPQEHLIADLGYKSENCDKIKKWDLFCTINDLVF